MDDNWNPQGRAPERFAVFTPKAKPAPAPAIQAPEAGDDDDEIEPADCPKCGGQSFLDSFYRADSACMVRVRCSNCPHHGPTEFGAASEGDRTTIKAWNDAAALATPFAAVPAIQAPEAVAVLQAPTQPK